jgi:hypothetical protein
MSLNVCGCSSELRTGEGSVADEERARQEFLLRMEQEKQTGEMERELAAVDKLMEKMHADITRCFWHSAHNLQCLK